MMMAETTSFGQNTHFRPNKFISAEYSVSAEIRFFQTALLQFRCFAYKTVSVDHYQEHRPSTPLFLFLPPFTTWCGRARACVKHTHFGSVRS